MSSYKTVNFRDAPQTIKRAHSKLIIAENLPSVVLWMQRLPLIAVIVIDMLHGFRGNIQLRANCLEDCSDMLASHSNPMQSTREFDLELVENSFFVVCPEKLR